MKWKKDFNIFIHFVLRLSVYVLFSFCSTSPTKALDPKAHLMGASACICKWWSNSSFFYSFLCWIKSIDVITATHVSHFQRWIVFWWWLMDSKRNIVFIINDPAQTVSFYMPTGAKTTDVCLMFNVWLNENERMKDLQSMEIICSVLSLLLFMHSIDGQWQ